MNLTEFKKKRCLEFIKAILDFKHNKDGFLNKISKIHKSFLLLTNNFSIPSETVIENEFPTSNGLNRIKIGKIELTVLDGIVLDVEDKFKELARFVVSKSIIEVRDYLNNIQDYESRCCDLCGSYYIDQTLETPTQRIKMDGFYLACHPSCSINNPPSNIPVDDLYIS